MVEQDVELESAHSAEEEAKAIPVRDRLYREELGHLNDFRVVLFIIWQHLGFKKPTKVMLEMAEFLQHGDLSLPKLKRNRQIIMAFRGVGKTWVTAAFVCWCLLMDPTLQILIVSKSTDKAKEILEFIRKLIREVPMLQHLDPSKTSRDTKEYFDVVGAEAAVQPSVKAIGINGQLPGNRADIVVPDDVETNKNSETQTQRDQLQKLSTEFTYICKPGGLINMLGTPQTQDSLYERKSRESGGVFNIRIWPARYPNEKLMANPRYKGRLAPSILNHWSAEKIDKITDPERWTEAELSVREQEGGSNGKALQYMLDASLSDADKYKLKLKDLIVIDGEGVKVPVELGWGTSREVADLDSVGFPGDTFHWPLYQSELYGELTEIYMAIDPSGTGNDQTAYAVGGVLNGRLYLLDWGGTRVGFDERFKLLAMIAKKWGVQKVFVEKNHGGGTFGHSVRGALAKYEVPAEVEDFNSQGQKEVRIINTLEPVISGHKLVIRKSVIEADLKGSAEEQLDEFGPQRKGFFQMTRLTTAKKCLKFDDKIDVLAMLVDSFAEQLGAAFNGNEESHKEELRKKKLLEWLEAHRQPDLDGLNGGLFDLLAIGSGD